MVKIHRIWFNTERMDREDHYKITLFSRPRVSIHVDEYIWSFIEENIVKPHKLMRSEKHGYLLDISFDQFDPAKHRYFPLSSYNGLLREGVEMDSANRSYFREDFAGGKDRTTWFSPNKIWTNCGDKVLNVDIKAANVSENITPREYADLLFDGIGAALVFNFKRLKREEFDGLKPKIDWSIVESFPFPAPFEEQRYIGDEGEIHVYSWDGRKERPLLVPIPCGSCTWSISENREEEFCRASLVKDGFWHWRDYLFGYHAKRRYAASRISELLSAGYGLVSGQIHHFYHSKF